MSRSPLQPETPRHEPEIIPPDRSGYGRMRWESVDARGSHRIYMRRLGPFSLFGIVTLFGLVVAGVLALFLGALLIALPVIFVLVAAAVIAGLLRRPQRRW